MKSKISFPQQLVLIVFGMFCCVIFLEIALRLGGLAFCSLQQYRNHLSIKQKGAYRIMCIGESTTQNQYPHFLEDILNEKNIGIKFSVIDKGLGGINTSSIVNMLESSLNEYSPNMVITMMGINDDGRHMPYESVSNSRIINFLKSFKTYKLIRLLQLHIVTGFKELGVGKLDNDEKCIKLGEACQSKDKFFEAELLFRKAIELNPKNSAAYVKLGNAYEYQRKFPEAELSFRKAMEVNPKNDEAYVRLGRIYISYDHPHDSEVFFNKAVEINPKNREAYVGLGVAYRKQSNFSDAEASFKKAIELNPESNEAYAELGIVYLDQGRFSESEASLKKAADLDPGNYITYGIFRKLYTEAGNLSLASEYDMKAKEIGLKYYRPTTVANYHKLKAILDIRGITYVCAQYPLRNIEPLKKVFQGNAENIIFVDNEKIFKDALKNGNYKDYFRDMFAGDFGHCTEKGNKLLADNIAKVILKEAFNFSS